MVNTKHMERYRPDSIEYSKSHLIFLSLHRRLTYNKLPFVQLLTAQAAGVVGLRNVPDDYKVSDIDRQVYHES